MQTATQEILHCQLPGNVMCSLAFFKHAIEQNVALQVAEKVELSSTVRKIYWEDECRLCRPIGLSPQVVSPHRSYLAPTSKLCRPNIEVVSPQGSVRNLE